MTPTAESRLSAEVQAYFDTTAASYDRAYRNRGPAGRVLRRRAAVVLGLLGSVPGEVLDAGMGAGFLCAELDRRGWVVSGVDIAPAMVEGARARLPHRRDSLVQGSIHSLPFESERFDAVVATGVLEYAVDDLEGAVRELGRVLEQGGVAVVSYPNHRAPTTVWRGRVVYPLVRTAKRALPVRAARSPAGDSRPVRPGRTGARGRGHDDRSRRPGRSPTRSRSPGRADRARRLVACACARRPVRAASTQGAMNVRVPGFRLVLLLGIALSSGAALAAASIGQQPTVVTVAGSGIDGHTGDGGPALAAAIAHPRGIVFLRDGSFVFAEPFANTVRRVAPDGTITTIAGTGETGYSGDGGPATAARLFLAHGVAQLPDGSLLVADAGNNRIRRIADGIITTVAGTGARGFSGDGGPAVPARIANPRGVAALPDGGFLIPDTDNNRVRRVFPDGTIKTVAGTGTPGFSGDGASALAAEFRSPFGVAPIADGGFLVVDAGNSRIRRVSRDGIIATVAGTGVNGFSGDDGRATSAEIDQPHNVAVLPDGGFMIADTFNNRVRRVWPDGTITTVAGDGAAGFSGDGGDPLAATLEPSQSTGGTSGPVGVPRRGLAQQPCSLRTLPPRPPAEDRGG